MKKVGIWLGGIGILLAVSAGISAIALFDTSAGDIEAIESSLIRTDSLPAAPRPARNAEVSPTIPTVEAPVLEANPVSRLDQLADISSRSPVGIRIEALGVEAPVAGYGIVERTGQMDVPNNVREVGWYQHGPSPGQPGSAVLAAHVDLKSQGPGVFFGLKTLDPGDLIEISYDDGSIDLFEVKARSSYLKDDLPLDVIFSRAGSPVLTLITCGGGFSASVETYDSNVVVYAVPIDSAEEALPVS